MPLIAGVMLAALLGVLTSLAYIVTGIVYLVLDRDTCKDGDRDTDFWIFCLTYSISGIGVGLGIYLEIYLLSYVIMY